MLVLLVALALIAPTMKGARLMAYAFDVETVSPD